MPPPSFFFTGSTTPRPQVNLSSGPSSSSSSALLSQAQAQRAARDALRHQDQAARTVQRVWRGAKGRKQVHARWRDEVRSGEHAWGADGVRRVCFGGLDVGEAWWDAVLDGTPPALLLPLHQPPPQLDSYLTLLRLLSLRLLHLASTSSHSRAVAPQLRALPLLLDVKLYAGAAKEDDAARWVGSMRSGVLRSGGVELLGRAIGNISPTDKKHPSLPSLVATLALHLQPPITDPSLVPSLVRSILTIPLLPNRLPIPSLALLSRSLPWSEILALDPSSPALVGGRNTTVNLLSNLSAFGASRVPSWNGAQRDQWASLLASLLVSIEAPLQPFPASATPSASARHESDDEDAPRPAASAPALSPKTLSHLALLASPPHLAALLGAPSIRIYSFLLALIEAWPAKAKDVLDELGKRRGVMRELWRGFIRSGDVGRRVVASGGGKGILDTLFDERLRASWPPFLLLTVLFNNHLHSLPDDEFFSPASPLSLDEITALSALWRNVAFALYFHPLPAGKGVSSWTAERVREVCERGMEAVYERDQRRSFVGEGHWLMTDTIDMRGFVDAAIAEEQDLDNDDQQMDVDAAESSASTIQSLAARRRKGISKRKLAFLSPRLGVLNNIPQTIPFEVRVEIFRAFIRNDKARLGIDRYSRSSPKYHTTIRRHKVAEDGYAHLNGIGAGMKGTVSITFVDQFGQEEAGIDGGGVFKEFLTSLSTEVFNTDRGLWQATKQQELYPAPTLYATESHQLDWYQFIGRVLGKALYEGLLADVSFAGFFLKKWLGRRTNLNDLASLDQELYDGLIKLKQYDGNVDDLALTFTLDVDDFGVTQTVELVPNGVSLSVTKENRLLYIDRVAAYKLNAQMDKQCAAFFVGLQDIIDPKWIRLFDQRELQMLVGGVDMDIDVEDLRRNTVTHGLSDALVHSFWNVVKSFNASERRALVRFVTSCPRPPMLGFKELEPLFAIRAGESDPTRLPSSATCVNLLKLPAYRDEATLRAKLLQAITSSAGFDLS